MCFFFHFFFAWKITLQFFLQCVIVQPVNSLYGSSASFTDYRYHVSYKLIILNCRCRLKYRLFWTHWQMKTNPIELSRTRMSQDSCTRTLIQLHVYSPWIMFIRMYLYLFVEVVRRMMYLFLISCLNKFQNDEIVDCSFETSRCSTFKDFVTFI